MSNQGYIETMEGIEMADSIDQNPPPLSEQEQRILEVYDKLEELQFEIALLKAQGVISSKVQPKEVNEEDIKQAQKDLLEAKANYSLRTRIIENVVIGDPILKAVHAGSNASVIEQDLLPLIQQRDTASEKLARLFDEVNSARQELSKVSSEVIAVTTENVNLSAEMIALAQEANSKGKEDIKDEKVQAELDELEAEMKNSKQRWKIMKNTASAVIVGSGIDWARDPKLLEIVLDDDGDES